MGFQEDLATVRHAENIVLDTLAGDIKNIEAELEKVHKTAADEAARLEAAGELRPFSLSELKELKTSVYSLGGVQHFNKVDHQSGRTPMERFALNSQDALKQATDKIEVLKKKYHGLLLYFGEDEKMPSNEFFGLMRRFIEEFQKACDMVDKMETQRVSYRVITVSLCDNVKLTILSPFFFFTDQGRKKKRKTSRKRKEKVGS